MGWERVGHDSVSNTFTHLQIHGMWVPSLVRKLRSRLEQLLRSQATTRESVPHNERYCTIQGRSRMTQLRPNDIK